MLRLALFWKRQWKIRIWSRIWRMIKTFKHTLIMIVWTTDNELTMFLFLFLPEMMNWNVNWYMPNFSQLVSIPFVQCSILYNSKHLSHSCITYLQRTTSEQFYNIKLINHGNSPNYTCKVAHSLILSWKLNYTSSSEVWTVFPGFCINLSEQRWHLSWSLQPLLFLSTIQHVKCSVQHVR